MRLRPDTHSRTTNAYAPSPSAGSVVTSSIRRKCGSVSPAAARAASASSSHARVVDRQQVQRDRAAEDLVDAAPGGGAVGSGQELLEPVAPGEQGAGFGGLARHGPPRCVRTVGVHRRIVAARRVGGRCTRVVRAGVDEHRDRAGPEVRCGVLRRAAGERRRWRVLELPLRIVQIRAPCSDDFMLGPAAPAVDAVSLIVGGSASASAAPRGAGADSAGRRPRRMRRATTSITWATSCSRNSRAVAR